jgi:chromosome segregation ATPase
MLSENGSENDNEKFKLSADEQSPESLYQCDADELKLEKLSQRVTLITFLIPVLIIVVLAITYLDIKHRVIKTETSGTVGVKTLSQELESRFSSLSLRQAQVEESQTRQTEALSQATADIGIKMKKSEDAINLLRDQLADKKELADATAKIGAALNALQAEVKKATAAEEALDAKLTKNLADIAEQLNSSDQRMEKMSREAASLNQAKISKEEMDLAVKLAKLEFAQTLDQKVKSLEEKLAQLEKRTDTLAQQVQNLSAQTAKQPAAITNQAAPQVTPKSKPKPTAASDAAKPDKIVEQDLH